MIGWYVHHHGGGHLRRLQAIRPHLADDARIFVLSGHMEGADLDGLVPVLNSPQQYFRDRSLRPGQPFAIQLDTGMNRLGWSRRNGPRSATRRWPRGRR